MPFRLGLPELLIILALVILVFGVGRISKIAGELGSSIRNFQKGLKEESEEEKQEVKGSEEKDKKQ